MPKELYTIGHSNRTLDEFLELLHAHQITYLVDIRAIPKSRFVFWFNKENLKKELTKQKIAYLHMPILGGRRHTTKDSINTGWHNAAFRGFADYMQTPEFFEGLKKLNELIEQGGRLVIMCAEAVPWRCHRSLIADAELARHYKVWDIINKTSLHEHKLTSFAVINRKKRPIQVYYPSS